MATAAPKKVTASSKPNISPEEWERRVDLAAAFRLVHLFGWSDLLATHLSARVPGPEHHFLINPFGLLFEEITASNLVKVDVDGNILSDTEYEINPAGFTIHSAVHMARPEAACCIHTHTQAGTSVATQKDGLLPITQHALAVIAQTGYHAYEGIATDLSEREFDRARPCPKQRADPAQPRPAHRRPHGRRGLDVDVPRRARLPHAGRLPAHRRRPFADPR